MLIIQMLLFMVDFFCVILTFGRFNPQLGTKFTEWVEKNRK